VGAAELGVIGWIILHVGKAEIRNHGAQVPAGALRQQNIRALEISMHNLLTVCLAEAGADL
jgi:hypothetical protein